MNTTTPNRGARRRGTPAADAGRGQRGRRAGVAARPPRTWWRYIRSRRRPRWSRSSPLIADGAWTPTSSMPRASTRCFSVLQGSALAGGVPTYTATCGPGLAFMFEPYFRTSGMRLPMVMTIVTRDGITPQSVWGGHQDAMTVREAGWIQIYCETVQEVLDTTVMAFRLAEHHDVMLPVTPSA